MPPRLTIRNMTLVEREGRKVMSRIELPPPPMRPFMKWAGGKQWLAPAAPWLFPMTSGARYFEPFLGGASMFFALEPERAVLSDTNAELVETYRAVRDDVESVIAALRRLKNDRECFDRVRRSRPRTRHTAAARMIYLNKTAFNGMYRVNRQGEFNVPFGDYDVATICQEDRLRRAARALAAAEFRATDFADSVAAAKKQDVVYFDPPYVTGHTNNGFIKYNAHLFSWEDQERLATTAAELQARGVHVVVSNVGHVAVLDLYPTFCTYAVKRNSLIGGRSAKRGQADEVVISSRELTFS